MPPVPSMENHLATVSTGYTVFERDQVLTHDQLNSVAEYADDQIRLSRARLGGVGIACGLRAATVGGAVRVTGGLGVTTDGDLLYLDADTVFDRWRPYDASFPAYPPLYTGGNVNAAMLAAYELIPAGTPGAPGQSMGEFAAQTGRQLASMTAVLLMESYRKDDDLCSGTDCDNLGAASVNTRKLIVVEAAAVPALRGTPPTTPAAAYAALPELAADRPALAAMTTVAQLGDAYRSACNAIHARLLVVLPAINQQAGTVLGGVVTAGSAAVWTAKLNAYKTAFAATTLGIQYYYDFLRDVTEAYNEFRERLFADDTWCSPPIGAFPKHLVLGDLASAAAANRTGYYPSPVTSRTAGELEHARFLAQRLDALINRFQVNTAANIPVRVTPSAGEDRPLEERAIPFYYTPGGTDPVHRRWSYRLARRGAEAGAYSYHAASYAPAGSPAANPLAFQLGRATFFRVEGVIGKPVQTAIDAVEAQIKARNLPFSVRAVLLGTNRTKIVRRPGRRLTPLHHIHQVIRKDATERLRDAETFTAYYSGEIVRAVDSPDVFHAEETAQKNQLRSTAVSKGTEVVTNAASARAKAGGSYTQYRATAAPLQQGITAVIQSAADLAYQAGPVASTGFITPLDSLAVGVQSAWLPWIDEIVDWQDGKADGRLLFSAFADEHPQMEHFGGVARGGTLVLVHDEANTVIAEVMLPYSWKEEPVDEDEPVLQTPRAEPPVIKAPPVRVTPSRKRAFEDHWTTKEPEIRVLKDARRDVDEWVKTQTGVINNQLAWQTSFLAEDKSNWQTDFIRNVGSTYENVISTSFSYQKDATRYVTGREAQFDDPMLGLLVDQSRIVEEKVVTLRDMVEKRGDDRTLKLRLVAAEEELANTLQETTEHLVTSGATVTAGTGGHAALEQMRRGMTALEGTRAIETARTGITDKVSQAADAELQSAIKSMIRKR